MNPEESRDDRYKWFIAAAIPMPDTVVWLKSPTNGWVKYDEMPVALVTYHLHETMHVHSAGTTKVKKSDHVYDTCAIPSYYMGDTGMGWLPLMERPADPYAIDVDNTAFMPRGINIAL